MILPCPACSARFMVPDDRITPKGIKIRCPKCRFVFIMKAQKKPAGPPPSAAGSIGSVAGAIGGREGGAAGSIGEPAPKTPVLARRAAPEGEAKALSETELATVAEDEILDMDDLAQATEQSGTAFNPNIRAEHFQLPQQEGPSVMIDDTLMAAAADHKASWTEEPTAPEHVPRIDPSQLTVADTWIDLPSSETPTPALGMRLPTPAAVPPAPPPAPEAAPPPAASGQIGAPAPQPAPPPAASGEIGAPAPQPAASGALGEPAAEAAPAAQPPTPEAAPAAVGALDSIIPAEPSPDAADDFEIDIDLDEPVEATPAAPAAPAPGAPSASASGFQMAYTLTAASAISEAELAELEEYEGLLVEERKALRKGYGAVVLTLVGIVGGLAILGTLGYLGWQALHPPERKPPSWGLLQLSGLEHEVLQPKGGKSLIRVDVTVRNASKDQKFENVHIIASLVNPSERVKCKNYSLCGPRFPDRRILKLDAANYHEAVKAQSLNTAYKVQLNGGQQERCQVVLFCGDEYQVGVDKIKVEIDKERSKRLME